MENYARSCWLAGWLAAAAALNNGREEVSISLANNFPIRRSSEPWPTGRRYGGHSEIGRKEEGKAAPPVIGNVPFDQQHLCN
uniref:Putative secreted protein n=1 Tax=Anopheles triannulatus TaxID=58253 RepID=A0A2M4B1R5_9DIPT